MPSAGRINRSEIRLIVGLKLTKRSNIRLWTCDAGVRPVDLVDDDDRFQSISEGFAVRIESAATALHRIDREKRTVGHPQHAATSPPKSWPEIHETMMSPIEGDILRMVMRAAPKRVGIDDQTVHPPARRSILATELPRLAEHVVHQRGFPVVSIRR